ncbi:MAG: hypothetical protein K2X47_09090, partial [Bdellovibrionales bacterium]|nr:hypothetical protein [Bdellovibrionales bacterium]
MNKYRDSGTVFCFSVISTLVFVVFAQALAEGGEAGKTDENHIGAHGSSALENGPQENPQMGDAFLNSQEIGIPDIEKLFFEFKITRGKLKKDIHLRGKIPKACGEFIGLAANCDSSKNIVTFDITERKPAGFDCLTKNRERCLNPSLEKCISLDDLAKGEKPSATIIQPVFKTKDSKAGKNSCAHINIKSVQIKFTQTFFISNNSAKTEGEFCPTCNQKEPL